jgi:hypothetical protein
VCIEYGIWQLLAWLLCKWQEDLHQISVDVKGMGSLQKSLDDYVKVCGRLKLEFWVFGAGFRCRGAAAVAPPLCVAVHGVYGSWWCGWWKAVGGIGLCVAAWRRPWTATSNCSSQ